MHVSFFEVQDWEGELIRKNLKSPTIYKETLTPINAKKAKNSEIISVFIYSKISKQVLQELPKLKLIITRSTGFDHIDLVECKKRKVKVCYIPSYGENTVAEHTFALILALSRKIHKSYIRTLKNDFTIEGLEGFDLKGKTLGVVGAGKIGKHVIRIARGFEMNVLVNDRHVDEFLATELNFKYVSFNELLKKSDIVTLHIPYSKENHFLINKKNISLFKEGSILINTSRGLLVDTEALLLGLKKKILSGVGIDVIEDEKFIKEEKELLHEKNKREAIKNFLEDHELIRNENVVFTPHIAFYSREALERIIEKTIGEIKSFEKGKLDKECIIC